MRGRTKVGDITKILSSNAVLSKGDSKKLTLEVVEVKLRAKELPSYKISHKLFQMENHCKDGVTSALKNVDVKVVDLEGVLDSRQ